MPYLFLLVYGLLFFCFFTNFLRVVLSPVGTLPQPLRWNIALTNLVAIALGLFAFATLWLFLITLGDIVSHWRTP